MFEELRAHAGESFEDRVPSEEELLSFLRYLREERHLASSSMWTSYSKLNSMVKAKYGISLKATPRLIGLLKSYDIDIKKKARIFSSDNIKQFVLQDEDCSPFWLVRKVVVILAFYGGLRQTELLGLELEMMESQPIGVYITHSRAKQRSDKRNSRFLVPCTPETGRNPASILDLYLATIKRELGVYTGRVLFTGTTMSFKKSHLGKNMVGKVPQTMAEKLRLDSPDLFTFHSFRRSAATAVAESGATPNQMMDFFNWSSVKMTTEYITTTNQAVLDVAQRLHGDSGVAAEDKTLEKTSASTTVSTVKEEEEEIWEDWNPEDPVPAVSQQTEVKTEKFVKPPAGSPIFKISAGSHIVIIQNLEHFHYSKTN